MGCEVQRALHDLERRPSGFGTHPVRMHFAGLRCSPLAYGQYAARLAPCPARVSCRLLSQTGVAAALSPRDRLVYEPEQLEAFAASEVEGMTCCGGGGRAKAFLRMLAQSMAGKVWSAKVYARKPG